MSRSINSKKFRGKEMAKNREKMICPDCGVQMNHHADKIDYSAAPDDGGGIDPAFDGIVEEAHTCPVCGKTHTRRAEGESEDGQSS
jgi:ribosomal protein S27AE